MLTSALAEVLISDLCHLAVQHATAGPPRTLVMQCNRIFILRSLNVTNCVDRIERRQPTEFANTVMIPTSISSRWKITRPGWLSKHKKH